MSILFKCKQNIQWPFINIAEFVLSDGNKICVDRARTEFTWDSEDEMLTMVWRNLYIWDGESPNYNIDKTVLKDSILKNIEVEDDAPMNYKFKCVACSVDGEAIPVEA